MIVGITSGVFDLLHVGHVRYLERCHALCDRLIVLVDSDDLVRERKGAGRPVIPLADRMKLLETLRLVFLVYPMPSLAAWEQCIKLHRLSGDTVRIFKHEGFADKEVVGANQPGVELIFVPDVPGLISTSEIIERVQRHRGPKPETSVPKAPELPQCTCRVRLVTGKDLPDCPRGLATGRRYTSWHEVPNDALLPYMYEQRNGRPPPTCSRHPQIYLYEYDGGRCCLCEWEKKKEQQ